MTDHEHKGLETYAHNPGIVSSAAGPPPDKNEHAPDPAIKRRPVKPLPAIPMEGNRPLTGLDLGSRSQMSQEAFTSKGYEEDLPIPIPEIPKDII